MVVEEYPSSHQSVRSSPERSGCCGRSFGVRKSRSSQIRHWFKKPGNVQLVLMITAVLLGVLIGCVVKSLTSNISLRTASLVGYPGELLMSMLKMLIIPLIVSTLISGIANLDLKSCGRIGIWTLVYYITTTLMAVILGIILVVAIHPGNPSIKSDQDKAAQSGKPSLGTLDALLDLLRNMLPPNIVQACTQQIQSQLVNKTKMEKVGEGNATQYIKRIEELPETRFVDNTNILGLVTFSVAFGLCLAKMGKRGRPVLDFFMVIEDVIMRLVRAVMWYAPIGLLFMITGKIISIHSFADIARGLGMYIFTITLGLIIHLFFVLALIYFAITRKNPYTFFQGMLGAFFTALGTGSSAATLPITFRCLEEGLKIDPRVTRFVLPVGATMNMDGTALYEAVATIFIAQVNDYDLSVVQLITISLTATMAAIGAAGVPHAGLVTLVLVVTAVGLPVHDITLILAVDWIIDRLRTSVNVLGDSYGAAIVAHLCRKQLARPYHTGSLIKDHDDESDTDLNPDPKESQTDQQQLPMAWENVQSTEDLELGMRLNS